jgi:hypothetical protein
MRYRPPAGKLGGDFRNSITVNRRLDALILREFPDFWRLESHDAQTSHINILAIDA